MQTMYLQSHLPHAATSICRFLDKHPCKEGVHSDRLGLYCRTACAKVLTTIQQRAIELLADMAELRHLRWPLFQGRRVNSRMPFSHGTMLHMTQTGCDEAHQGLCILSHHPDAPRQFADAQQAKLGSFRLTKHPRQGHALLLMLLGLLLIEVDLFLERIPFFFYPVCPRLQSHRHAQVSSTWCYSLATVIFTGFLVVSSSYRNGAHTINTATFCLTTLTISHHFVVGLYS